MRVSRPMEAAIIVAAVLGFATLDVLVAVGGPPTTGWLGPSAGLVLQLSVDVSVLFLARTPWAVGLYTVLAALAMLASDLFSPGLLVPENPATSATSATITPVVVYNLVSYFDRRRAWILVGILVVLATRPWEPSWAITPFGLLSTAVPALLAMYVQARQRLVRSLRDRAERAEREQELLAEQARAEERSRLAAEMHDIVSHRLSLMVLQASALRVTTKDDTAREAAEELRASGCQALEEMRDLVGVLREHADSSDQEITGLSADLSTLAAESESVGVPVELAVDGDPERASPVVARTAYRVVQEALTNVRKHAPGARVRIVVRYGADRIRLSVRNTAPRRDVDSGLRGTGSGAGLHGLRQRVELIRGSLQAESTADGGFEVSVILPVYVPTAEVAG
ncbi:MAG: two-component sensor histidine kinase [Pseudonocardiaceae bacterium]|nr:two-component sensor histidine kinase [Pseudonocardiaceae bacterium]